jgi:hypothetical protein
MAKPRTLSCDACVEAPYDRVAAILRLDPRALLQRATTSAAVRAASLAATLRVTIAGLELGVRVRLLVRSIRDVPNHDAAAPGGVAVLVSWEAMDNAAFFPSLLGELVATPFSGNETQLELHGSYWPPMGPFGSSIDTTVGHRIAEAALHRFLDDVCAELRSEASPVITER